MTSTKRDLRHSLRSGFTLVELAVVVAILTVLAGIAIPATTAFIERQTEDDTAERMQALEGAIIAYVEDTLALPTTLADLATDPSVAGWRGPYIGEYLRGYRGTVADYDLDGWRRAFTWVPNAPSEGVLESAGADGFAGSSDDLILRIDLRPTLRERTLERLRIVNIAINNHNERFASTQPLSGNASAVVTTLIANNWLPGGQPWDTDAFGTSFETVGTPVVAFRSSNAGSSPIRAGRSGARRAGAASSSPPPPSGPSGLLAPEDGGLRDFGGGQKR